MTTAIKAKLLLWKHSGLVRFRIPDAKHKRAELGYVSPTEKPACSSLIQANRPPTSYIIALSLIYSSTSDTQGREEPS